MSKAVGNPLEIRLRALAEKAALDFPKETKVTITTEAQRNDPDLFYNCYPELFEIDYLRTLPRPKVTFAPGTIGLDLHSLSTTMHRTVTNYNCPHILDLTDVPVSMKRSLCYCCLKNLEIHCYPLNFTTVP